MNIMMKHMRIFSFPPKYIKFETVVGTAPAYSSDMIPKRLDGSI